MRKIQFIVTVCFLAFVGVTLLACASGGNLKSDYSEITVAAEGFIYEINVEIKEVNASKPYATIKLSRWSNASKRKSETIRVPNGDYYINKFYVPLWDNKVSLYFAHEQGTSLYNRILSQDTDLLLEYSNLKTGEPVHSEIVIRREVVVPAGIQVGRVVVTDNKTGNAIYAPDIGMVQGRTVTINVVSGDYTVEISKIEHGIKERFDLNGERVTFVMYRTSPGSREESARMEDKEKINSGSTEAGRSAVRSSEFAALDAIVNLLYQNMNTRINAGLRLAMLPVNNNQGVSPATADYITDQLTITFLNSGQYEMLERSRIDQILAEQNFQTSGNVDNATAVKAGQLLGANAIMVAHIEGSGESRRITLRALDVGTGRVLGMAMEQF
jgi:hypothetical protein